ncbi:MAG: hypothetical protein HY698_17820 [Deltaproteobacteria bacterium]|nr:hypothetical protein [Deltaproteobacteria bacterium]
MHEYSDSDLDDPRDQLSPDDRLKAAAQILARGIRRLLTSTAPPIVGAKAPTPPPQPPEYTETVALPVVPTRALMRTKAG